jgi:hypothetical protein
MTTDAEILLNELKLHSEPVRAKKLSYEINIPERVIADLKNEINEYSETHQEDFFVASSGDGYQYVTVRNPFWLRIIDKTIAILRSRALNILKNLRWLKKIRKRMLEKQLSLEFKENQQHKGVNKCLK